MAVLPLTFKTGSPRSAALAANLELLKKNGMTVTQFGPAEVAKLREKMKPVIAKYSASVGEAKSRCTHPQ